MNKIFIVLLVSSSAFFHHAQAQFSSDAYTGPEVGAGISVLFAQTDVGTTKSKIGALKTPQLGGSIYAIIPVNDEFGVRLELLTGRLHAEDAKGIHLQRNLDFTTAITEISLMPQYHLDRLLQLPEDPTLSPYIGLGVGYLHFDPYTFLNGVKVKLQPLRTEGQGFNGVSAPAPYSLNRVIFLGALGVSCKLSEQMFMRFEVMLRKTGTDYLDDVSTYFISPAQFDSNLPATDAQLAKQLFDRSTPKQNWYSGPGSIRGNPNDKDAYWSFNLKLGIRLW